MRTRPGTEPYDGRHLHKWLMEQYRPNLLPQSDATLSVYELPTGMPIAIPGPSAEHHQVSTSIARRAANALGMSFDEFRAAVGHPIINHGKPSRKPVQVPRKGCTRSEVLSVSADVRSAVFRLENTLRDGAPRDPAFYIAIHARLVAALVEMNHAIERTSKVGAINGK